MLLLLLACDEDDRPPLGTDTELLHPDGAYSVSDADLTVTGTSDGWLGRSLAVGDADGDGHDDLLVGTYWTVAAFVLPTPLYSGGSLDDVGLPLRVDHSAFYGVAIALADMTGDGQPDAMVGGPEGDPAIGMWAGPIVSERTIDDLTTQITAEPGSHAGYMMATGDVTGDGAPDLVLGDPYPTGYSSLSAGAAYVVPGPLPAGSSALADVAVASVVGQTVGAVLGYVAATGGDVDGDGIDDLALTAGWVDGGPLGAGVVYLFLGPWDGDRVDTDADAALLGVEEHWYAGESLAFGDLDGDGLDDLAVGAPGDLPFWSQGAVYVVARPSGTVSLSDATVQVYGTDESALVGTSVAIGDGDADGVNDLLVGAANAKDVGAMGLFWGPVEGAYALRDASRLWFGEDTTDEIGNSVAFADFDVDGRTDAIAGGWAMLLGFRL